MTINKGRDFLERVGWTFIQTFLGTVIASNLVFDETDWRAVLYASAIAGGIAAAKVVIAQNIGDTENGDLLPGAPVIEDPTSKG